MDYITSIDWRSIFTFDIPFWEIFVRGTIMYLGLFLLLRVILKRESGTVGISDLLVVVLLADASQNAMSGGYDSVPDGFLLVLVIVFWSYVLNWIGYKVPFIQKLIHPPELMLVKDGTMLYGNMRKELITEGELWSMLRQQGIDELSKVKRAYMEGDGQISVIEYDEEQHPPNKKKESGV